MSLLKWIALISYYSFQIEHLLHVEGRSSFLDFPGGSIKYPLKKFFGFVLGSHGCAMAVASGFIKDFDSLFPLGKNVVFPQDESVTSG